jgi:hypothetical protein
MLEGPTAREDAPQHKGVAVSQQEHKGNEEGGVVQRLKLERRL